MKVKQFTEILGRLIDLTIINGTNELNDFSPGSTISSIYESMSLELEQYYMLSRENILYGIEHGIYEAFDFPRRPARKAYGNITIEFHSSLQRDVVISQGTVFYSNRQGYNQEYEVLEDYLVPRGSSAVDVRIYCTEVGTIGNVPAGVIDTVGASIFNVSRVYNQEDFLTGRNLESLEDVKRRFRAFVETRGRATNKSIRYGTRTVDDITGVYVDEETGYIKVYTHDGNGNLPSDLKREVEVAIEDYRPSGIKLDVLPIVRKTQDLEITVMLRDTSRFNEPFQQQIELAIRNYVNRMEASDDLILTDLIQEIMNIDDYSIRDCEISNLDKNVILGPEELMRAGFVNVKLKVIGDDL